MALVHTGKLPFITHLAHPVPPAHLSSLPSFTDPDEVLEDGEKLDSACWKAYIEGTVVDIVVSLCVSRFAFVARSIKQIIYLSIAHSLSLSSAQRTGRTTHTTPSLPITLPPSPNPNSPAFHFLRTSISHRGLEVSSRVVWSLLVFGVWVD